MKKRILSLVLALSMMISLFPVSALAQTPAGGTAVLAEENGEMAGTTGSIAINNNGVPVTDGLKTDSDGYWIGAGWKYMDGDGAGAGLGTLTLMSGTWDFTEQNAVKCDVMILKDAVVSGGTFEGIVWNEADGKISGGTFKKTVSNKGTITGGIFVGVDSGSTSVINYDTGKITGGVFENNVTNGDSGDEGISASITGGLFKAKVQNKAASATITGGVFVTKPTGSGTIANVYTLTTSGRTSKFLYAADEKEIDLGQSVYVIPNDTDALKVVGDGVSNWDVADSSGTHALTNWDGVTLKRDGSFALNPDKISETTLTFTVSTTPVTPDPELVLAGGVPDTSTEHAKQKIIGGKTIYYGNGWEYDGTTLKLNPTSAKEFTLNSAGTTIESAYLNCDLEIGENATAKGTIALTRKVINNGTIDKVQFGGDGKGHYPSLTNNGTVKNCSIALASVTNNKTMENVSFVTCSKLENSVGATIENAVVRKDSKSILYRNCGTMKKAVFDFSPSGEQKVRILKASRGEKVVARLDGCEYVVFGTQLYVVGEPTLKIKISDADNTTITDVNGNVNYGGLNSYKDGEGYQQFAVQSGNGDIVLNQTGAPNPSEVKYTLTLVNAEPVDMTGTEFTENATIKIKPKFTDEEFELDCWTSETTGFDVSSIQDNKDGTYTLKMPGNELKLTANGRKKTYSLTVVNGYIGDATDIRSGSFEKGAQITIVADAPANGFAFVDWNALNGTTCPVFSSADKDTRTYKFEMPAEKVELEAVYEPTGSGELVLVNGVPDINNAIRRKVQDNVTTYFGRGWEYRVSDETDPSKNLLFLTGENFVLDKNSSSDSLKCNLEIGEYTKVKGMISLTQAVKIEGAVDGMYFDGAEVTVDTIGTVTNSILHNVTVTNNGNIKNCVSDTKLPGAQELTEANGATITATFDGCAGEVSGETLYFTGTPTLKVKVKGATVEKANGEDVGQADENGWYTVTAAENGNIKLTKSTPTPNPDDQPKTYTVTVKGGTINGKTEVKAKKGTKLTVDVDESEVPEGMTFDVWSIRFPEGIKDTLTPSVMLHEPHMAFAMPGADITIEAQYRSSELPGEDDGPSTLGTMATVAVGGAAAGILVWQGVSLGVDSYLQLNLPKGVAVPANRRELVVLLWETAGKPEAALPSLYSDVPAEEIELQKATRWAIDNGLVKPADDSDASRFDPDRYVTKYDVFGAWLKLKKLMK